MSPTRSHLYALLFAVTCILATATARAGAIHDAAAAGDMGGIDQALAAGADINAPNDAGSPPLILAVNGRHTTTVALLLANGANPDTPGNHDYRPLHFAGSQPVVIGLLTRFGADPNATNADGETPLFLARSADAVDKLMEAGAKVDVVSTAGLTPLARQVAGSNIEVIQRLLHHRADVDGAGTAVPLILAVAANREPVVALLLHAGADVSRADATGRTALHYADRLTIANALIKRGADVNHADAEGNTPLHHAASPDLANLLIYRGAKPELKNAAGQTPHQYVVAQLAAATKAQDRPAVARYRPLAAFLENPPKPGDITTMDRVPDIRLTADVTPAQPKQDDRYRTWTTTTGKNTVEARYLSADDQNVRLERRDGFVYTVRISRLSDADRAYITEQRVLAAAGQPTVADAPPPADTAAPAPAPPSPVAPPAPDTAAPIASDDIAGTWRVTFPAGARRDIAITILPDGRIQFTSIGNLAGIYQLDGQTLRVTEPKNPKCTPLVWRRDGPDLFTLVESAPAADVGADYTGAVLRRKAP